jgi:O-6-methylguanine DNA methyltransferase
MYYSTKYPSPVGSITLACADDHLVGLWIEGQKYHGGALKGAMSPKDDAPVFAAAKRWLDRYFAGENPAVSDVPLAPIGTTFRRAVWDILCKIPYGRYVTYGSIAKAMADATDRPSMSAQAVGGAVGHNPISIIIPCHRVVGASGSLTGYAGGIGVKARLLELEGADMSKLFAPTRGTAL